MRRVAVCLVMVLTGPAGADSFRESGYVGGGAGLTYDYFFNAYLDVEGGLRLPSVPLWIRGSLGYGVAGDVEGSGSFLQARLGVEARTCGSTCLFVGLDVGRQTQTWGKQDETTEHHEGWLVGPRVGLDAGGAHTRFRLALEAYRYLRTSDVASVPDSTSSGAGITFGIVHRM
jgi:hypothetical protein